MHAAAPLFDAMRAYAEQPQLAFHTPGHKLGRGIAPELLASWGEAVFRLDLTELDEVDDLAAPEGVIRDAQALAAAAFGAEATYFLVNGPEGGVQALLLATCTPGDTLVVAAPRTRALEGALALAGVKAVHLAPLTAPGWEVALAPTPAQVAGALARHPEARAVLVASPTAFGCAADLAAMAEVCHGHDLPLLVDETHGAHLAFHPELPASALASGADAVVQGTAQTLPALVQAAMIHLQGPRIRPHRLRQALHLVQTSSPSYVLLASLDVARRQAALHGEALLTRTLALATRLRTHLATVPGLAAFEGPSLDPTRVLVDVSGLGLTGPEALARLRSLGIQPAGATAHAVLFVLTIGTTEADITRLQAALQQLPRS